MASRSSPDQGSRFVTAATAPARTPRAVVVADASVEGFFGDGWRRDREAAARAAVFRLAAFVFAGARFVARVDALFLTVRLRREVFAAGRAPRLRPVFVRPAVFFLLDLLPDFRLATPASHPIVPFAKGERRRGAARQVIVAQDPGQRA